MPNINTINGLTLCDETNVNGVTIANITNIDGITKSCGVCNELVMSFHEEGCVGACGGELCNTYYVNTTITCPLLVGAAIYNDAACSDCAATGRYSPQNCDTACAKCYTYNMDLCQITAVADCR